MDRKILGGDFLGQDAAKGIRESTAQINDWFGLVKECVSLVRERLQSLAVFAQVQ